MSNKFVPHKNYESDTVHGHNTHMAEKSMQSSNNKEIESERQRVNVNKLCDDYERREMQKEKVNVVKRTDDYREHLLKQMHDKEEKTNTEDMPSMNTFSEEFLNPTQKHSLKLQKQKEAKQGLDDCIKRKHDLKLESQRTELAEEQERSEFWRKRDDENVHTVEKAKQESERKEHSKNEVAKLWIEEKRKDVRRDNLNEKGNITDLNKHQEKLLEVQKSIRMKKELFKENVEKINEWMKNLELIRNEQEKLKKDIVQEEELEQSLKLKSDAMQ